VKFGSADIMALDLTSVALADVVGNGGVPAMLYKT